MNRNFLFIESLNNSVETEGYDVIICKESFIENKQNVIIYDGDDVLEFLNKLLTQTGIFCNDSLTYLSGNYILYSYLSMLFHITDGSVEYRGIELPLFPINFDFEEINIYRNILKKIISKELYSNLPIYLKNIYEKKDSSFTLTTLGENVLAYINEKN